MTKKDEELRKTGDMKSDATVTIGKITVNTENRVIVARRRVKERDVRTSRITLKSSRRAPSHVPVKKSEKRKTRDAGISAESIDHVVRSTLFLP